MNTVMTGIAIVLLLASAIPLSRNKVWWIRVGDFPRLQLLILIALWFGIYAVLATVAKPPHFVLALLMLGAFCYQAVWIYPYTTIHKREVPDASENDVPDSSLKLLVCNVLMSNRNSDALLSLISQHDPDIVATLESNQWWQDQLDPALSQYQNRLALPLDNLYGMHVYSKLDLHDSSIQYVVEDDVPSMQFDVQMIDEQPVRIHIVHPAPPAPGENEESTERDVELLLLAKELEKSNKRVVVTGDLNDVAWSATTRLFRQISGLLDPRVGRGLFNSFHADYWYARWPLDHVFVSNHFSVVDIQKLGNIGSDHFPILVHLSLAPAHTSSVSPEKENADEQLIKETLETTAAKKAMGN